MDLTGSVPALRLGGANRGSSAAWPHHPLNSGGFAAKQGRQVAAALPPPVACSQAEAGSPRRCRPAGESSLTHCQSAMLVRTSSGNTSVGHLSLSPLGFSALHRPDFTFQCQALLFPVHSVLLSGGWRELVTTSQQCAPHGAPTTIPDSTHRRSAAAAGFASPPSLARCLCLRLLPTPAAPTASSKFFTEFFTYIRGQKAPGARCPALQGLLESAALTARFDRTPTRQHPPYNCAF